MTTPQERKRNRIALQALKESKEDLETTIRNECFNAVDSFSRETGVGIDSITIYMTTIESIGKPKQCIIHYATVSLDL